MILTWTNNFSGPDSPLRRMRLTVDTGCVSVGALLQYITDSQLKTWGEDLAVALIQKGSLLDDIGQRNSMPTLHFVVKTSVKISKQLGIFCYYPCIFNKA